jgi:hypothetical protein
MRRWFNLRYGLLAAPVVFGAAVLWAQDTAQPLPGQPAPIATAEDAGAQKGVEVLTRGPIHEAFASLASDPEPTKPVMKKPPAPIEEMPPTEKPDGDVIWIKGYWAWDEDRNDYLWVSGVWRTPPPGKEWVPGYWREDGDKAQWVPGFWTAAGKESGKQDVTYLPQPPAPPEVAPPAKPPAEDTFYVPGHWVWNGDRYAWQAGYWARVQPGYVWVAGHYRWSPSGYIYIPGYWDLAVSHRGVLYAPVVITPSVVTVGFVYTPCYAVQETVVVDTLWVRPCCCHYYYGDYYGDVYHERGFESVVVYNERHYDCIIVYERWDHRREPDWYDVRVRCYHERYEHPERRPPRTLVEARLVERRGGARFEMVASPARVAAAKGQKLVVVDERARHEAMTHAAAVHQAAVQRIETERKLPQGAPAKPQVASLSVPSRPASANPAAHATTTTTTHTTTTTTTTHSTTTPPGHTLPTPPGTGLVPTGGHQVPPGTGVGQTGSHPTTLPPGHSTTPSNRPPPSKDKDKDKDKSH